MRRLLALSAAAFLLPTLLQAQDDRIRLGIQYQAGIVWVQFVGTHAQYDRIDVETVNDH